MPHRNPKHGDRVVEIPQAYSDLMVRLDGAPLHRAILHVGKSYGTPRFKRFDARYDPAWGYGLLVIEDNKVFAGPSNWDSSG